MAWYINLAKVLRALVAIAGAVVKLVDVIQKLAPDVRAWWNGKKIAVLGPTAAGKNSLYRRLQGLPIPLEHAQTRGAETVQNFKFEFPLPDGTPFSISCKRAINVGGEVDERERYWLGACEDADVVFYMLTVQDLEERCFKIGARINDDLRWLAAQLPRMAPSARIHLLVNKIDLITDGHSPETIASKLRPAVEDLEDVARGVFGQYQERLTGVTPTSMMNDHLFAISFGLALKAVHEAVG